MTDCIFTCGRCEGAWSRPRFSLRKCRPSLLSSVQTGSENALILGVPPNFPVFSFFTVPRGKRVVEASNFVVSGKRLDGTARLLIFSLFLVSQCFLVCRPAGAQSDATPAPAQQPATPQLQPPPPAPTQTPEERARVLREAQARINARRQARIQQIINETYGHKFETYFGGGYLRFHP